MGGLYASGRWHSKGRRVIYTAESVAGCTLESVVHMEIDAEDVPDYRLLGIELPDAWSGFECGLLPDDWKNNQAATQLIGDNWLAGGSSPALRVPSAIAPQTWNILINPMHPQCKALTPFLDEPYTFDGRLLP